MSSRKKRKANKSNLVLANLARARKTSNTIPNIDISDAEIINDKISSLPNSQEVSTISKVGRKKKRKIPTWAVKHPNQF